MFRNPPCYERFVQLIPSLFLPLIVMLHYLSGKRTGIYYADSTHFAVCKNIRINSNRTFNNLAKMGRRIPKGSTYFVSTKYKFFSFNQLFNPDYG
ncbi:hypothetical protein RMONA_04270 [Rickettsia monacensis]|uniref:Transposase DDE domain-containing protein n=2 Tax=Rickettsia monacensis TaxID=109232 RepID=A0A0B7J332_9RICK|nr:hypothetical protein RMONA_01845 [Rickettsia monacensis]CEO17240.1 hypothetical protein RMONA_04270 [Rickettsia monacensis]